MEFNLEDIKKHPYEIGAVVIIGGIVVLYLLSSSSSGGVATGGGSSDYQAALAADAQLAQVQAGAQVQSNAQQVALQQAQIEAGVSNYQTQASIQANDVSTAAQLAGVLASISGQVTENTSNNNTALTEEANQLVETENTTSMQDSVLEDQINSGVVENANNNATALGADTLATNLASLQTQDTYQIAQQQLTQQGTAEQNVNQFLTESGGLATVPGNNLSYVASLLGGEISPTVSQSAVSINASNHGATAPGNTAGGIISSVGNAAGSVLSGLFG